ncbi:MAG: hypothetical protein WKF84_12565 [Pyrinomonadaceae bacterium]
MRATAVRAVLSLPTDDAASLLCSGYFKIAMSSCRREAADALGATELAIQVFQRFCWRWNETNRQACGGAAAVALGQIKDELAVSALIRSVSGRRTGRGLNRMIFRKEDENEFVRRPLSSRWANSALLRLYRR